MIVKIWFSFPQLCVCVYHVGSLTAGEQHCYYSHDKTTVDRASMACEDRGTRLMTLDELLAIRNNILADDESFVDRFIWVFNPVTAAPLAVKMRTREQRNDLVTAYIICKSSSEYSAQIQHNMLPPSGV